MNSGGGVKSSSGQRPPAVVGKALGRNADNLIRSITITYTLSMQLSDINLTNGKILPRGEL